MFKKEGGGLERKKWTNSAQNRIWGGENGRLQSRLNGNKVTSRWQRQPAKKKDSSREKVLFQTANRDESKRRGKDLRPIARLRVRDSDRKRREICARGGGDFPSTGNSTHCIAKGFPGEGAPTRGILGNSLHPMKKRRFEENNR